MLAKAIRIAAEAFENKPDKAGNPYILHCLQVMHGVSYLGKSAMIVGVLHDLLEDTKWTAEDLRKEGFPETVIRNIEILTRTKGENYMGYIKRIRCAGGDLCCS